MHFLNLIVLSQTIICLGQIRSYTSEITYSRYYSLMCGVELLQSSPIVCYIPVLVSVFFCCCCLFCPFRLGVFWRIMSFKMYKVQLIVIPHSHMSLILKNLNVKRKHYDLHRTIPLCMVCTEFRERAYIPMK